MGRSPIRKLVGSTLILAATLGCGPDEVAEPGTDAQHRAPSLRVEGLAHPVPAALAFETVMNQREWLRAFCPEETLILSIDPGLGLSQTASQQLKRALTSEGCDVVDDTPEMREKFLNPESGEWVREHYKGAFIGSASIGVESDNGEDLLAITVGWYKGRMTAKAEVVAFRWDGARWVARTDLKVIRVS